VELKAPDGLNLTWHLRTELGAGPMALLTLRDFKLPRQIFLSQTSKSPSSARKKGAAYERG
jgi:type VI secretion system protein ImpL